MYKKIILFYILKIYNCVMYSSCFSILSLYLCFIYQYKFAVIVMGNVDYISDEDQDLKVNISQFLPHSHAGKVSLLVKWYSVFIHEHQCCCN